MTQTIILATSGTAQVTDRVDIWSLIKETSVAQLANGHQRLEESTVSKAQETRGLLLYF